MAQQRLCVALISALLSIATAFGVYDAVPCPTPRAHWKQHTVNRQKTKFDDKSTLLSLRRTLRSSPIKSRRMELYTAINGGFNEIPPHATNKKSNEEYAFIKEALLDNVLFSNLPESTLDLLIMSFEKTTASRGERILTQGELCDGDYVYLVGKGECTVIVDEKVVPGRYHFLPVQSHPLHICGMSILRKLTVVSCFLCCALQQNHMEL